MRTGEQFPTRSQGPAGNMAGRRESGRRDHPSTPGPGPPAPWPASTTCNTSQSWRRTWALPPPSSGDSVPLSYIIPHSVDDLIRRRRALEIVAYATQGMMGRSPDYVNIQLTATRQMAEHFGGKEKRFADNIRAFHEYAREQDVCMTHAFGHPQVNRGGRRGRATRPLRAPGRRRHHQ